MPIKKSHGPRALVAAVLVAAALPSSASAAEGIVAGACVTPALTQPFESLGDPNRYFLAPGGDFEQAGIWSVSGDYDYKSDERPGEYGGAQALKLEGGSSATSPVFCADDTYPHLRLAAKRNRGGVALTVEAVPQVGAPIVLSTLSAADHAEWTYSGFVPLAPAVGIGVGEMTQLQLRVRAVGDWTVDAVAVDPRKGA
jgi:hypothetical protein